MRSRATDLNQFLNRRRQGWSRLETLLQRVEDGGIGTLTPAEIREFGTLYRRTSSDLVSARAKTANAEVLDYLNDLVARAYAQIYRSRRFEFRDIITFLSSDFPRLLRLCWKPVALAAGVMLLFTLIGWELNRNDPAGSFYMLPTEMVKELPILREQWARQSGHYHIGPGEMSVLSSFIMTHNIAIGIICFVGGIACGIPTLWAMMQTGLMVGILGEGMTRPETAVVFWSLILPHGILELSALAIMGGAGFVLAGAVLSPGRRSRRDALLERGRAAVLLALGGGAMLVVSGLIEGFVTPPAFIPPWAKLVFALLTLIGEVVYFLCAGRGPQLGKLREWLGCEDAALP